MRKDTIIIREKFTKNTNKNVAGYLDRFLHFSMATYKSLNMNVSVSAVCREETSTSPAEFPHRKQVSSQSLAGARCLLLLPFNILEHFDASFN